jgi:hypothetical protein
MKRIATASFANDESACLSIERLDRRHPPWGCRLYVVLYAHASATDMAIGSRAQAASSDAAFF